MRARPTQNRVPCEVHVRDAAVYSFSRDQRGPSGKVVIAKGQNCILEREIFGEFRKFNSNNGWNTKTGGEILAAFSHWSWAVERKLVCDLQGYQGKPPGPKYLGAQHYYLLTDPAIMTAEGMFGITDIGMKGIQNWFSAHTCNDICRSLGIAGDRPSGIRTMVVESSSSLRETENSYGPSSSRKSTSLGYPIASVALSALAEEDEYYDSSSDSDYYRPSRSRDNLDRLDGLQGRRQGRY